MNNEISNEDLLSNVRARLGVDKGGLKYPTYVAPPSFKPGTNDLDDKSALTRRARFIASGEMLFKTDLSTLDETGASALYEVVTEGMFGLKDSDGQMAFGKRAKKNPRENLEMLRRFVKGEYNLIEDPEYTKWREMDEEGKFRYALENEPKSSKIRSYVLGERGAGLLEHANAVSSVGPKVMGPDALIADFFTPKKEKERKEHVFREAARRSKYDNLNDEEKAAYRADVIGDYEKRLSRRQTLATYLQFSSNLSDKAAYLLAESFQKGVPDINVEMLDPEERDRVYSAFSLMRGDKKRGRILGIKTDFTDDTAANRFRLGLYGLQQSLVGLVTDTGDMVRDGTMWAYAKATMDDAERKAFFEGWDANVRAERAMEQALPDAEGWFGAGFQGLMENVHWFIPYGAIGKGGKMAATAGKTAARAGLMKEAVTGMRTASELKAAAAKIRWLSEFQGAVNAGRKIDDLSSVIAWKNQVAAVEKYTKALQNVAKVEKSAKMARIGGRSLWTVGEASSLSAFSSEYIAAADAAGISREESVITAFAIGLINAQVERLYVAGLESSLTPAQVKALTFKALYNAVKSDGAAGFRKWFANRVQRGVVEGAKVTVTEGMIEDPLQQLATEHGIAFDKICQELRAEGKADVADQFVAFWQSFAKQLPKDYGIFIDTVCDSMPTSLAFGVTTVGNAVRKQHLHNAWTRHQNHRAGSTHTMFGATSPEELRTAIDYDAGLVDLIQQGINTQLAVEKHWKGDESDEAKNPNRFAEALTAARRAYRNPQTRDVVQEVAEAAGVDVKTAEVITQYLQTEAEAIAFSPQARAFSSLRMSLADIDETTIKTVLPGYIEGSYAADEENGIYSGRVKLGDGTERTIAYRVGDVSEMLREQVEENSKIDSSYGVSFDMRQEELGTGITWASLSDAQRYQYALTLSNGISTGRGVFELTDAKGEKVRVNADDVIYLANGRLGDIGYGLAATMGTARHETFHSLWRFARATLDEEDVQMLAKALGVDVTAKNWENKLDEAMAHQLEMYASGHYVSHAVSSRFDKMLDGWAGKVIKFFGSFGPADEVRDPKTGKPFALKNFYDAVLRGELGSGKLGVEIRNIPAAPAVQPGATDVKAGTMPVEVTDEERAAQDAEMREEAAERGEDKGEGEERKGVSGQESGVSANPSKTNSVENPADASVPNQRYYIIGLPNSDIKLVGRLEVRDAHTGLTTSTDEDYHDRGNQNRDDKSEESRALVNKIAAHPDPLQIGTVQPIANNGIAWALPNGDVIIGNHRVNGVRAAYEKGTADDLEKFVREDAAKRGIEIGEHVKAPLTVFILEKIDAPEGVKADEHEVVRLANESQNRGFNIREQAGNDAKILIDNNLLPRMAFRPDGRIDETKSADAIGKFRQESGAQGMVGEDGMLTEEGQTRLQNAAVAALLAGTGNNALLGRIMDNAGRLDMASQLRALMKVTPELMALAKTKPEFDIRDALAEALTLYTEWREKDEEKRSEKGKSRHDWRELDKEGKRKRGLSWEAFMSQGDMFRTPSEEAKILGDLFARTESLRNFDREDVESAAGKKRVVDLITDYLTDYIENARNVNTETDDMFGSAPALRDEVLAAQRAKGESGARFSIGGFHGALATGKVGLLREADKMEKGGASREEIWRTTGWWRGKDGKWRVELPDIKMRSKREIEAAVKLYGNSISLGELVVAPELFKAYPALEETRIILDNDYFTSSTRGSFDPSTKDITLNGKGQISLANLPYADRSDYDSAIDKVSSDDHLNNWIEISKELGIEVGTFDEEREKAKSKIEEIEKRIVEKNRARLQSLDSDETRSILAHEIQHWIQENEGFAKGGNVKTIREARALNKSLMRDLRKALNKYGFEAWADAFIESDVFVDKVKAARLKWPGCHFLMEHLFAESRPEKERDYIHAMLDKFESIYNENAKEAHYGYTESEAYRSLLGEVEARNVQRRLDMSPEERAATPPWETESVPENRQIVRFSIGGIFTGSAANYEKPSLHYVGSGEGSQVYGWGLYGSNRREVAEAYARPSHLTPEGLASSTLHQYSNDRDAAIAHLQKYVDSGRLSYRALTKEEIARTKGAIEILKSHAEKRGHLYEQTFFTNRAPGDESHLLKWYEPMSEEQKGHIEKILRDSGLDIEEKVKGELRKTQISKNGKLLLQFDNWSQVTGEDVYGLIKQALGSPKAASEFLARAGIDGVKYPVDSYGGKGVKDGDEAGWNYVSFRDDNIRVDHKWVDGEQRFSIVTLGKYRTDDLRSLAHRVKDGDAEAIAEAGRRLAVILPPDAVLVPMPSHTGEPTTMRLLADAIAANANDAKVVDALRSNAHESNYAQKKRGEEPAEIEMRKVTDIPENAEVYIVDNVIDTGATYSAAMKAIPNAHILALADTDRTPEELRSTFKQNIDKILSRFDEAKGLSKEEIFKEFDNTNLEIGSLPNDLHLPQELSVAKRTVKAAEAYVLDHLHNKPHHAQVLTADDARRMLSLINPNNEMRIVPQRSSSSLAFIAANPSGGWDCVVIAPRRGEFYVFKTMFAQKRKPYQDKSQIRYSIGLAERGNAVGSLIRGLLTSIRDIDQVPQIISNSLPENNGPSAELLEAMGRKAAEEKKNAEKNSDEKRMYSIAPDMTGGIFPEISRMSDDELVTAAVAVRMALGETGKFSDRAVKVNTVNKLIRRLHPEYKSTDVGRESMRVISDARKFAKKIREDLDRGVSDSLILEHLPKTAREQFGREMVEEARRGQRLGRFGQKVTDKLENRQARIVEDAVRIQTGMDVSLMENLYGINLSETLMHLAENPLTEKPPQSPSAGEGETAEAVEESAGEEAEPIDVSAAVKAAVDEIVGAAKTATDANERNREDRRAAAGRDAERAAELDGEDATGGGAGDDFGGEDIVARATKKAKLDLENPRHLAEFVAELTRRYWIKEHELGQNAEVWRDLVAVQFLRKTAQGIYAKLCKDLTYSRSRETAMQRIAKFDHAATVQGLLTQMTFVGALINSQRIRDTKKALCEKLDLFLRQKFGAQGRFKPDKEEGKRNVSAEAELRAQYMRHAMWLTPDAAAEEARELQEKLDLLAVEFSDAGRDRDQSREFVETIRKLNVLREFGALRYKSVGEIEAAAKWWEDFERGEADDIVREMSDRNIRTKKAAELLAKAFADPKRVTVREGVSTADRINKALTGHFGFISIIKDCMRHATDADREAVKDIVGWLELEIQKAGDGTATEKRHHNDAFHAAVESIYAKSFKKVMKEMMVRDDRFLKFMGEVGGKRDIPTKGRAMQLLVSLLQEGRKVEVEDEENPGKTKFIYEGGYHDNIVKHKREGQAAELMKLMSPADMNMIKWLGMWYEQNRQDLSRVCHSLFGIGVYAELPNYFPVKMRLDKQGLEKGAAVGWTIFPKALTPRVKNERDFDTSADIFQMWSSRMEEGAQWKHHAQLGLEMRGIFGRAELQGAVISNHGEATNALMQGFITDVFAGKGAVDRSTGDVQYISDKIRGWTVLCALGGNVGVMFKQLTSIPAFGFEIGLVDTARHIVSAFTPEGLAAMGKIWQSEQRKTRWDVGYSEAVANALREDRPSKPINDIGGILQRAGNGSKEAIGLLKRMLQASMITNKIGDVVPALVVGQGIYRDCIAQGMSETDAMAKTWMIVERTQQSSRMENLASIQRRNVIGRMMYQFLSTQRQYLDYELRAIREVIAQPTSVKRWKKLGTTTILNHFILTTLYWGVGQLYKAMLGQEPPEDQLTDAVISCLMGPNGSLFVVGFCCNETLQRAMKGNYYGSGTTMLPMESWIKTQIGDGIGLTHAIFDREGDTWDNMLDAAGKWMSDSNSLFRDLRKIYRFRIKGEEQKKRK